MIHKTTTSPAGDTISILSDDEWVKKTGSESYRSIMQWNGSTKPYIVRALWEHGEFTNKSGQAIREMYEYIMQEYKPANVSAMNAVSTLLKAPQNAPAFERELNAKRTFSVKLVAMPESWHRKLMDDIGPGQPSTNGDQADIPEPSQGDRDAAELMEKVIFPQEGELTETDWDALKLDAPTVFDEPPPLEIHIAHQVAMSMLTAVVEIISSGTADTSQLAGSKRLQDDMQQVQSLLGQRLEENQRLRMQVREAGDMINALKVERDGLRTRLRMTEHNLKEALRGETAQAVNAEIHRRVDQIMRTAPTTSKGE